MKIDLRKIIENDINEFEYAICGLKRNIDTTDNKDLVEGQIKAFEVCIKKLKKSIEWYFGDA